MEIIFHSHANKTHFHKRGCAPSLIFKVRVFGTRKWPIDLAFDFQMYILSLDHIEQNLSVPFKSKPSMQYRQVVEHQEVSLPPLEPYCA